MSFVNGGEAALTELRAASYDVIVSDMRMPGMDGATLLTRVLNEHPHIVRIVLSGQTEQEVSRRMVHVAHQFMSKPCDGEALQQIIERACRLQSLLEHPSLRQAVGQIGQLPVKPSVYTKLVQVLADPNASIADAASVIEGDIGTSAKILQVVNSAFFGLSQRIGEIKAAVSYLGLEMVKMLALSVEMRESHMKAPPCVGFDIDAVQEHGMLSARIARRLLSDKTKAQDAFAAAMLQDAGALVLMSRLPEAFAKIVAQAQSSGRTLWEAETESLGVSHAEIGGYLLGIWGLPYTIVEAVAHHHAPERANSEQWDVVGAVHVAGALAAEVLPRRPERHVDTGGSLDMTYLGRLGVAGRLPGWRAIAAEESRPRGQSR
jgi:HD-like signal output (HDOD) protein/CheY-like chemotaxis protein